MAEICCVDASVVLRLVLGQGEAVQSQWQEWNKGGREFAAPCLLYFEATNVLYRYARLGYFGFETANISLEAVLGLPIHIYNEIELHQEAFHLARQLKLPAAYDAHYLALARSLGIDLWTADQRLAKACPFPWVNLIQ